MKILVVDDAVFMRTVLKSTLQKEFEGCEITEASNGKEAIDRYEADHPDLVTMDITMPEMDGIAAVKTIKAAHPEACIIMCSAMGQQNMVIEAVQAGAKDFIVKPFQPEKIVATIKKYAP